MTDKVNLPRRQFLKQLGYFSTLLGAEIVYAQFAPKGWYPIALGAEPGDTLPGKEGLTILNNRPINAETPPHLLGDKITPANRMFVRNNGIPPTSVEPSTWRLDVAGESASTTKQYSIEMLKQKFETVSLQLTLECGGNGRSEFEPAVSGNQWSLGAVASPTWQGVRLKDVLQDVGIKSDAVYVAYYGADSHLSGDVTKSSISRGVPIAKALEDEAMIAWGMNGADIHPLNGAPLRLVIGGWPASTSGKWLTKLLIRDRVHDGAKMTGKAYRVPKHSVAPGVHVDDEDMEIIESMPVKSLITSPKSGIKVMRDSSSKRPSTVSVAGHAWAGDRQVKQMALSIDFGQTWKNVAISQPVNRFAWQHFETTVEFSQTGYYEIWAKATDDQGVAQPMVLPGWNPKGYLNNACHRVAVTVV